ncbi:TIGR01777 family oxidoreductase [Paenibacillus sp. GCM10027626]|uniref:TIGR01777 family oxidoreductase n=1 Tax=Paenibacillus sp. GCM10027626 TaxID=3273411 RepID=UPI00363A1301
MHIAVTGGTGFVGRNLIEALIQRGDRVTLISRSAANKSIHAGLQHAVTWKELEQDPSMLEGVDAIVNLAGESINQRWTAAAKQRILQSRLDAAASIAALVDRLRRKPEVVINASGISIYGASDNAAVDESSPHRLTDFLGTVVEQWEDAADRIQASRLIKLRISVVLGNNGGAFPLMALPYRLFAGGRVGSGRQWLSWIHIEDIVCLIMFCIDNKDIQGPVNASSPEPVTNEEFGKTIGKAMGRPHWIPVPAFAMKLLFGEMSVLLLEGQQALPNQAVKHGFHFLYPTLAAAAKDLVGSPAKS